LIVTSRTPNTRPRPAARLFRVRFHDRPGLASRSVAERRRIRTALVGLGLVALMGLTTWAVASISAWLVPAYLSLMVLILAAPRGQRASSASEPRAGSSGAEVAELGRDPGTDRAAGVGDAYPAAEPDSDLPAGEATEALTSRPDPAGAGTAKPRRSRVRARKTARTAAEPAPDSPSVAWIRVGPGKFVRADLSVQVPDRAPAEAVADANPATDAPAAETPPSTAPAATELERDAPDSPESTPGDEGVVPASDPGDPGSVTEEYGIAPSAFGTEPRDSSSACGSLRTRSGAWCVVRGAYGQRSARTTNQPRGTRHAEVRSSVRSDLRLEPAARRAFGRTAHVQRAWRPRSPPGRLL
jgi:hypothetical protein